MIDRLRSMRAVVRFLKVALAGAVTYLALTAGVDLAGFEALAEDQQALWTALITAALVGLEKARRTN